MDIPVLAQQSHSGPRAATVALAGSYPPSGNLEPVGSLLTDGTGIPSGGTPELSVPDRMVRARLGPYVGLFYALKAKHPPAAAHCLRVAIGCSKWAEYCNLPDSVRDVLEIAGLVHDIGKVGVPDCVLQKPEALNTAEQLTMDLTLNFSLEVLRSVGASSLLIESIQQARLCFDSGKPQNPLARMLKIVDAFDSMTTVQVFRPALSKERAIDELFANAGTQFDPELVKGFARLTRHPRPELEEQIAKRWLVHLVNNSNSQFLGLSLDHRPLPSENFLDTLFHEHLLDSLPDAAIYLDNQGKILHWNRAAEQISGRSAESVLHCRWDPKLMGLHCEQGQPIVQTTCPLNKALVTNTRNEANLTAIHTSDRRTSVKFTAIPLFATGGAFAGFIVLVRDASLQSDLEQKVRSLHAIAAQDPLTKVANRNELNRRLEQFVLEHTATGLPGAMIMCDIDYFKRINDNYSHQAGDEALITFASILRDASRAEDFVARFGGEEFVVLCDNCEISTAHSQAEKIRQSVERTPVPSLGGETITSSFGVTQLQAGDSPETLLARADRALMAAKEAGRNRVVQLGVGSVEKENCSRESKSDARGHSQEQRSSWLRWFTGQRQPIRRAEYLSAVPIEIVVEKLQGFIRDHNADVLSTTPNHISIQIKNGNTGRRRGEHTVRMIMNMEIQPVQYCTQGRKKHYQNRTKIIVSLYPVKARDRRYSSLDGQAQQILLSFQAYIVVQEIDKELSKSIIEPR